MTIDDLDPQEKMLLFLMRLSDALPAPGLAPDKKKVQDFFEHQKDSETMQMTVERGEHNG